MRPDPLFTYCVTCQCLTPLGALPEITLATGIYTEIVHADSEQQAHRIVMERIAEQYKDYAAAIKNGCVGVLDDSGHIVNYFWGFRSHRI